MTPEINNKENGFTLAEVLTVAFIIAIISLIAFTSYRQSGFQLALNRSASKLAQDLRMAEQMAMGASVCPTGSPCAGQISPGYGINLNLGNTNYGLYSDKNNDQDYDPSGDDQIETLNLEKRIIIEKIYKFPIGGSSEEEAAEFSINFKPPDPEVKLSCNGADLNDYVRIVLALESNPTITKTVRVNRFGLIEVE